MFNPFKGVVHITNSTTYMAILEEGEAQGRLLEGRNLILRQGRKRFGEPSEANMAQLNAINSVETIEALAERLLDVENWQNLFE